MYNVLNKLTNYYYEDDHSFYYSWGSSPRPCESQASTVPLSFVPSPQAIYKIC